MPNFVKSGKYFYKVNQKTGDKTRISKEEYKKRSAKNIKNKKKKIVKNKQISKKFLHNNRPGEDRLNIDALVREKLKKVDKNVLLNSIIGINFDVKKGEKLYNVKARLGKCPKSGYYVYKVNAQDVSENSMSYSVFTRSLMSTNSYIFNDLHII